MAIVDSRRRITLPAEICKAANICIGDEVKCFIDRDGVISLIKQSASAAKGLLQGSCNNPETNEEQPFNK